MLFGHASVHRNGQQRHVRVGFEYRDLRVDMRVNGGGTIVAIGLNLRIARIVADTINHPLADPVHFREMHVGEAGYGFKRFC